MYGYRADDAIGRHRSIIAGDDEQRAEQFDMFNRVLSGEMPESIETRRTRKAGTFVDISLTLAPVRSAKGAGHRRVRDRP